MIWQKKAQHEDDEPASGSWKDTGLAITFFLSLLITIENLTKSLVQRRKVPEFNLSWDEEGEV